jgi:membrane-associated HD superfamily phosphohydrolase
VILCLLISHYDYNHWLLLTDYCYLILCGVIGRSFKRLMTNSCYLLIISLCCLFRISNYLTLEIRIVLLCRKRNSSLALLLPLSILYLYNFLLKPDLLFCYRRFPLVIFIISLLLLFCFSNSCLLIRLEIFW